MIIELKMQFNLSDKNVRPIGWIFDETFYLAGNCLSMQLYLAFISNGRI